MAKIRPVRWLKYKYLKFIRIKDRPGSIATGAALGLFFDVLPTFGLGVIAAYFLATLLKVNRIATVISAVVFKLCIPVFAYLNFLTGSLIMNEPMRKTVPVPDQHYLFHFDWSAIGTSFLVGSVINASIFFVVAYTATYHFVCWRRRRAARLKARPAKIRNF